MEETAAGKAKAFGYAVLLHGALFAALAVGLIWHRATPPPSVRGSVIEAVLVTAAPASSVSRPPAPPAPVEQAPLPQPQPAPRPQQAEQPAQPQPQQPVRQPDTTEQEKAALLAQQQAQEQARREQEERRRQEQVQLEEKRKQEEAEQRERLRQQVEEQQKQLAEIRRQREAAEQKRKLEQERMRQIADRRNAQASNSPKPTVEPPQPQLGNQGVDESLLARYQLAIQKAVEARWARPETVRPGLSCEVRIVQIPGGEVIETAVQPSCPYDDLGRRSVEAAILRDRLPYTGFETVFRREIIFTFKAPEN